MILHLVLLSLLAVSTFLSSLSYVLQILTQEISDVPFLITTYFLTFLVQEAICFVCWTMGSSKNLKNFECNLVTTISGVKKLEFRLRSDSYDEAVNNLELSARSIQSDLVSQRSIIGAQRKVEMGVYDRTSAEIFAQNIDEIVSQFIRINGSQEDTGLLEED